MIQTREFIEFSLNDSKNKFYVEYNLIVALFINHVGMGTLNNYVDVYNEFSHDKKAILEFFQKSADLEIIKKLMLRSSDFDNNTLEDINYNIKDAIIVKVVKHF